MTALELARGHALKDGVFEDEDDEGVDFYKGNLSLTGLIYGRRL